VTLVNVEKNFERHAVTNLRGEYTFELIPPGRYRVRAEAASFAPSAVNVDVAVATSVRADLVLRIQQVREEVRVIGEGGVSVQTENADLGRVVSPTEMTELPSVGRSLYDFVALMTGATLSNDAIGVGFANNGGRTQSANYLLDGAENNETMMSAPALDVPLDSIQEFNVQAGELQCRVDAALPLDHVLVVSDTFERRNCRVAPAMVDNDLAAAIFEGSDDSMPNLED